MVVAINEAGVYEYVSDQSRNVLGYAPEEMVGRNALDFAAPQDASHAGLALQDAMLTGESVVINIRARAKSGVLVPVRGSVARFEDPITEEVFMVGWVIKTG